MSPAPQRGRVERFPGFDAQSLAAHWDPVTSGVVLSRTGMPPDIRFFTPAEQAVGVALCEQLLDQPTDRAGDSRRDRVPVLNMIDGRLAEKQTDGWRYADMPHDGQAWRDTLAALDRDAHDGFGVGFAACSAGQQSVLVQAVQDLGAGSWHGLCARHVWSLWTRYVCTAFYSHPSAWDEMGFPGPAYPRGYKNIGVNALEPFEVPDAHPDANPVRGPR